MVYEGMDRIKHRFVATNGVDMHIAELGTGPAVLFLHGFPEIWYSWRHQILALADAGFHAIVPDLRGYGLTQNTDPAKNDWLDSVDDVLGLLDAIGEDKVFVVAKDWGAFVAYHLGYAHPERINGLVILGMPFRKPTTLSVVVHKIPEGHYVSRWAKPGVPEADFGRFDVATVIRRIYTLFSKSEMPIASEDEQTLDLVKPDDPLPKWMTEDDLKVYAELYEKSTFEYPMQVPYRCWQSTLEKLGSRQDFTIPAPSLLVIGKCDYSGRTGSSLIDISLLPQLKTVYIEEGTHFMQEQFPEQVNGLIVSFLTSLLMPQDGQL